MKWSFYARSMGVRYMLLVILGGVIGKIFQPEEEYFFLCLCIMGIFSVFLNIPLLYNEKFYSLIVAFILGFWLSLNIIQNIETSEFIGIITALLAWIFFMTLLFRIGRWIDYNDGRRRPKSWDEKNRFPQRNRDLERIFECIQNKQISSIGIEAAWGTGKSFVMEGLKEKLERKGYILVSIDIMAIRLDSFSEYLINELDDVLFYSGRLSFNSRKLKHLLRVSKLDVLSVLWGNIETRYTKIFNEFREELLALDKHIVLVYEDIDRIDDTVGIKNILYLSEKLTEKNEEWEDSSIKIIYQYNPEHMKHLGFDSRYLEKYIQKRLSLTQLNFSELINSLQKDCLSEDERLSSDEIYRLPPYLYLGRSPLLSDEQEREWMEWHFRNSFTIRRTKCFLQVLAFRFSTAPFSYSERERALVVAFSFIEYFMPDVYDKMNKYPLYRGFDVSTEEGETYTMREIQQDRRRDILNPERYPSNFEMYIAWRLFGLDGISAFNTIRYGEVDES